MKKYSSISGSAKTSGSTGGKCFFRKPFVLAKMKSDQPGDMLEKEADSMADHVAGTPETTAHTFFQPKPTISHSFPTHSATNQLVHSHGEPLDAHTKTFMEQRFGHDFHDVRVHTDSTSQHAAASVDALAFTHGNHIVFGEGQYQPHTDQGKKLLAHELTHTLQQKNSNPSSPVIQMKSTKRKFYQQVIDVRKKRLIDQHRASFFDVLSPLVDLCKAVEEKRIEDIDFHLYKFIEHIGYDLGAIKQIDPVFFVDLSLRLIDLGLYQQATDLRINYTHREGSLAGDTRANKFFTEMVRRATIIDPIKTPDQMKNALIRISKVFVPLTEKMVRIGEAESRYAGLDELMKKLVEALEAVFQRLMDHIVYLLSGKKQRPAGLTLLQWLSDYLKGHLYPAFFESKAKGIDLVKVTITKTTIYPGKGGQGVIDDWFTRRNNDAAQRRLLISTYDPGADHITELTSSLENLYIARRAQVDTLFSLYGNDSSKDPSYSKDRPYTSNVDTIKAMGGKMRLNSDDDWRNFAISKYRLMIANGSNKQEAFLNIIETLFAYLQAFTQHAHHVNVYDIGKTNYLNRRFPRSLAGKLLHDCGVYAVRVAYILSLVRMELGLSFRFVSLPVHIALLIEGEDMPTYIVQNEQFTEIDIDEKRQKWDRDLLIDPSTGNKAEGKNEFIGTVVANEYIPGVSMPFRIDEVSKPTKNAAADQQAIWKHYQKIARIPLFGKSAIDPGNFNYLFENKYLSFSQEYRTMHDTILVPYWNVGAIESWKDFTKALQDASADKKSLPTGTALQLLIAYKQRHDKLSRALVDALKQLQESKTELSRQLAADPDLLVASATITSLTMTLSIADEERVIAYIKRINDEIVRLDELSRQAQSFVNIETITDKKLMPFFLIPIKAFE